jgi:mono/diheme cytochrome c family protein
MKYPYLFPVSRISIPVSLLALALVLFLVAGAGPVIAQVTSAPAEPPEAAGGLVIFAERCANCHGAQGLGDGELAANLPNPPAVLASSEYLRQAVPADMMATITEGRVELGMPPFGPVSSNPLSEESRWQAIAAIYSLGTPAESVEQGLALYEENCLACHGQMGQGDGEEAGSLNSPPPDLSDLTYWSNTSSQAIFDLLADTGRIAAHDYSLEAEELWPVVDYVRTFGYEYVDALAAFRPLEEATVSGIVDNGTTGDPAPEGTSVRLRAFTRDLDVTLTLTTTVQENGSYHFDLTEVPQDWFFRAAVIYEGIEFGSDFGQASFIQPQVDLPVIIYEKTDDPANIVVNQLHTIFQFSTNDEVEVNQLYVASNTGTTVFAGRSGDVGEGTFEISLPDNAQLLEFQRGFGSLDNFFPANELIATETGWADTLPVRPGQSTLVLLVRYTLPYVANGTTLSHPLSYDTAEINLVIPAGVQIVNTEIWQDAGLQTLESGSFSTFSQADLPAGTILTAALEGRPQQTSNTAGSLVRNDTADLLIGGGIFLVVAAAAIFAVRQWHGPPALSNEEEKEMLLEAIADLDDDFAAGDITESEYKQEREALMVELRAIWE